MDIIHIYFNEISEKILIESNLEIYQAIYTNLIRKCGLSMEIFSKMENFMEEMPFINLRKRIFILLFADLRMYSQVKDTIFSEISEKILKNISKHGNTFEKYEYISLFIDSLDYLNSTKQTQVESLLFILIGNNPSDQDLNLMQEYIENGIELDPSILIRKLRIYK